MNHYLHNIITALLINSSCMYWYFFLLFGTNKLRDVVWITKPLYELCNDNYLNSSTVYELNFYLNITSSFFLISTLLSNASPVKVLYSCNLTVDERCRTDITNRTKHTLFPRCRRSNNTWIRRSFHRQRPLHINIYAVHFAPALRKQCHLQTHATHSTTSAWEVKPLFLEAHCLDGPA